MENVWVTSSGWKSAEDEIDMRDVDAGMSDGNNDATTEGERSLAKGAGAERLVTMKSANLKSCRVAPIVGVRIKKSLQGWDQAC
jgi:hypothetical protein